MLPPPPPVLLILGTDAAGKDYVADFLIRRWQAAGHILEKRAGGFSAPIIDARSSSERKGRWGRFREQVFLNLFPLLRPLIPNIVRWLLERDLRRFRPSALSQVVVSHTVLRLLAFTLGQRRESEIALVRCSALADVLRTVVPTTKAVVVVLDIDPNLRHRRIQHRIQNGTVDPFDRYMVADPQRAEQIEACLVALATRYLNATVIANNDLDEASLEAALTQAIRSAVS